MWKLLMSILCVPTPNPCLPHQVFDPAICCSEPNSGFTTLAQCEERRDFVLAQGNAFVLSAQCYKSVSAPVVRLTK